MDVRGLLTEGFGRITELYAGLVEDLDDLVVATDSDEVRDVCQGLAIPVVLTSSVHRSGSDRVLAIDMIE